MVETDNTKKIKRQSSLASISANMFRRVKEKHDKAFDQLIYENFKAKYTLEFSLSERQFNLIWEFFYRHTNEKESSLDIKFIRQLMNETLKSRVQVKATAEHVERALTLIDYNKDGKISLDEFLQLLSLFFASSVNIKSRLVSVLKNESLKHANIGNLNAEEAKQFENFLYNFYGLNNEQNSSFTDDLSYTKIAELFSQKVSSFLFVKL